VRSDGWASHILLDNRIPMEIRIGTRMWNRSEIQSETLIATSEDTFQNISIQPQNRITSMFTTPTKPKSLIQLQIKIKNKKVRAIRHVL
jgi:hypothetical protein